MAHVENDASLHGFVNRAAHLTPLIQYAAVHAVKAVSQDVALTHHFQYVVDGVAPGCLRMNHDR